MLPLYWSRYRITKFLANMVMYSNYVSAKMLSSFCTVHKPSTDTITGVQILHEQGIFVQILWT